MVAIKFTPTAPKKKSIGQRDPPPCVFPSPRRLISGPDTKKYKRNRCNQIKLNSSRKLKILPGIQTKPPGRKLEAEKIKSKM